MTKILIDRAVVEQTLEALEQMVVGTEYEVAVEAERVMDNLRAALEEPDRAQKMRDAGYTRRPTLREMAESVQEPQEHLLQQALEALLMMRDRYGECACPACDHADAAVYALKDALAEDPSACR